MIYKSINKKTLVILSLVATTFIQCTSKQAANESAAKPADTTNDLVTINEQQYHTAQIQLGKAAVRDMGGTIHVSGKLDVPPENMVSISVPYGGIVQYTNLLQGQQVKRGETLSVLENPEYIQIQQDYAEAVHQLDYLRSEYERQKDLKQENITATKTYQKALADYETMKVRAAALKQKLLLIGINPQQVAEGNIVRTVNITSPIAGYVTKVLVNRGKYVQANDALFELADTRHTHCELSVFEKDVPLTKIGDKVTFRLGSEQTDRKATVVLIGKEIGDDRTVRVHCHLDKEDPTLLPGSFISATIQVSQHHVLALPDKAIVQGPDKYYVYVYEGTAHNKNDKGQQANEYRFRQVPVIKGLSNDGYTQVEMPDGATDSTNYVVNGAFVLYSRLNMGSGED